MYQETAMPNSRKKTSSYASAVYDYVTRTWGAAFQARRTRVAGLAAEACSLALSHVLRTPPQSVTHKPRPAWDHDGEPDAEFVQRVAYSWASVACDAAVFYG